MSHTDQSRGGKIARLTMYNRVKFATIRPLWEFCFDY